MASNDRDSGIGKAEDYYKAFKPPEKKVDPTNVTRDYTYAPETKRMATLHNLENQKIAADKAHTEARQAASLVDTGQVRFSEGGVRGSDVISPQKNPAAVALETPDRLTRIPGTLSGYEKTMSLEKTKRATEMYQQIPAAQERARELGIQADLTARAIQETREYPQRRYELALQSIRERREELRAKAREPRIVASTAPVFKSPLIELREGERLLDREEDLLGSMEKKKARLRIGF